MTSTKPGDSNAGPDENAYEYESTLVFNRISNLSWWKRLNGTVDTYRIFQYPVQ